MDESPTQIWESVSLAACGAQMPYEYAACKALYESGIRVNHFYTSSGGFVPAVVYLTDQFDQITVEEMLDIIPCGPLARNMNQWEWFWRAVCFGGRAKAMEMEPGSDCQGSNRGIDLARDRTIKMLRRILNCDPESYKKLNGRLHVMVKEVTSFCSLFSKGTVKCINQWYSNEDVVQCFQAASEIPLYTGPFAFSQYWRGRKWIDGAAEISHPVQDRYTVCIATTPFDKQPNQPVCNLKWGRPLGEIARDYGTRGSTELEARPFYLDLYNQGYKDALCYIQQRTCYLNATGRSLLDQSTVEFYM